MQIGAEKFFWVTYCLNLRHNAIQLPSRRTRVFASVTRWQLFSGFSCAHNCNRFSLYTFSAAQIYDLSYIHLHSSPSTGATTTTPAVPVCLIAQFERGGHSVVVRPGVICGLRFLLVLLSALRGFSRVLRFPPHQHFQFLIRSWNAWEFF